jgi:putative FmdB family regulatory protein
MVPHAETDLIRVSSSSLKTSGCNASPIVSEFLRPVAFPAEATLMPIHEYSCRACQHQFEALVRGSETPRCPSCSGEDLERLISLFAVDSEGSRALSLSAARRANAKVTRDKAWADYEYERKHRHE